MEVKSFIKENNWLNGCEHGWGNGYVAVSPEHPLYRKSYSDQVKVKNIDDIKYNGNIIGAVCASIKSDVKNNMISLDLLIDVHFGLTFSTHSSECKKGWLPEEIENGDWWIFGFDTCHCDDNQFNWTKSRVAIETEK